MRFFTIRAYRLYLKSFEGSWLAVTTTIFLLAILALRRLANCWPENITTNPLPQRRGLHKRLWRLFSHQSSPPQALWWSSIVAYTNAPIEESFDGLCARSTGINQWEKRQLQRHSSHRQSTHKNGLLQTGQDHPWCTRACKSHYRRGNTSPQALGLNCYR